LAVKGRPSAQGSTFQVDNVHYLFQTAGDGGVLLYSDEVFQIQGAVFDVSREMGTGFLEAVYQECLGLEFAARGIPFAAEQAIGLRYRGRVLSKSYTPDFVCYDRIIVELKAVADVLPQHRAQLINYLKASGLRLGLLVNFGRAPKAQVERFVL
jgi:GxxExxY protein